MLILIASALLALVVFGVTPGDSQFWQAVQNAAHAPVFIVLALIVLRLLRSHRSSAAPGWLRYLSIFAVCLLLGVGIEAVQALIGGDASSKDILVDGLGTVAGLAGFAYFNARRADGRGKVSTTAMLLVSLSSLGFAGAPLMWACAAYINRDVQFPTLAGFRSPLDLYFLSSRTSVFTRQAGGSLLVELTEGTWPGVALDERYPDWTGYRTLVVQLRNPDARPLSLTIRVHDAAHARLREQRLDDRYNAGFEVGPETTQRLTIPLTEIRTAPTTRRMDLHRIAGIVIFGTREIAGRSFYLDRIWLE